MAQEDNRIKIRELPDSDVNGSDLLAIAKSDIEKTVHASIREIIQAGLDLEPGAGISIESTDAGFKIINTGEFDDSEMRQQIANLQAEIDQLKNMGGANVFTQEKPPVVATQGDLWWDTNTAALYVKYNDVWIQSNLTASGGDMPVADSKVLGAVRPSNDFVINHSGAMSPGTNFTLPTNNRDYKLTGLDDHITWQAGTSYHQGEMVRGPEVDTLYPGHPHRLRDLVLIVRHNHTSTSNIINDINQGKIVISTTISPAEGAQLNLENPTGGHYSIDTYQDTGNWFGRGVDRTYMRLHDNTGSGNQILFDLKDGGGAWMVDSDNLKHGDSSPLIPWCCGGGNVKYEYIDRKSVYNKDSSGQSQGTTKEYDWETVDVSDLVPSTAVGLIIHARGVVDADGPGYSGTTWIDVKSDKFKERDVIYVRPDNPNGSGSDTNTLVIPYTGSFQVRARFTRGSGTGPKNTAVLYVDGYINSGEPTSTPGEIGRIRAIGSTYHKTGAAGNKVVISNSVPAGDWLIHLHTQENGNSGADEEEIMSHARRYSVPADEHMWFKATGKGLWNMFTGTNNQPAETDSGWNQLASWSKDTSGEELTPGETVVLWSDNNSVHSITGFAIEVLQPGSTAVAEPAPAPTPAPAPAPIEAVLTVPKLDFVFNTASEWEGKPLGGNATSGNKPASPGNWISRSKTTYLNLPEDMRGKFIDIIESNGFDQIKSELNGTSWSYSSHGNSATSSSYSNGLVAGTRLGPSAVRLFSWSSNYPEMRSSATRVLNRNDFPSAQNPSRTLTVHHDFNNNRLVFIESYRGTQAINSSKSVMQQRWNWWGSRNDSVTWTAGRRRGQNWVGKKFKVRAST